MAGDRDGSSGVTWEFGAQFDIQGSHYVRADDAREDFDAGRAIARSSLLLVLIEMFDAFDQYFAIGSIRASAYRCYERY